MIGQWKRGDVFVDEGGIRFTVIDAEHAIDGDGDDWYIESIDGIRPLLVIDPEDREQVERLARVYTDRRVNPNVCAVPSMVADRLQAALREFAQSEDPEPMGLGAVVRDGNGADWVRIQTIYSSPFLRRGANGTQLQKWADLPRPLTVLSPGWTEGDR